MRPLRTRVFVGCEGRSEQAYVRWLQERADQRGLCLYFDSADVSGGDPLSVVEKSIRICRHNEKFKGVYGAKLVLLDEDRIGHCKSRDAKIGPTIKKNGFGLIYQRFDHEALLLRHLPGCSTMRPPRGFSLERLLQHWPDYLKPATFLDLERRLTNECLVQALNVEPALKKALAQLGFTETN